jgi:hypothetical protein
MLTISSQIRYKKLRIQLAAFQKQAIKLLFSLYLEIRTSYSLLTTRLKLALLYAFFTKYKEALHGNHIRLSVCLSET